MAFLLSGLAFVFLSHNSLALDAGTDVIANTVKLGLDSPIKIATRIINFVMIFLGIIAVSLMIYAGFKWMTSGGNEDQVSEAKRTLKMAVIGLVIILSAWGVTVFVLNRLVTATGNSTNSVTTPGDDNNDCVGFGCAGSSCDSNSLLSGCQAGSCQTGLVCSPSSCTCATDTNSGGQGDVCSSTEGTCTADNTKCNIDNGLRCNDSTCICEGSPVITEISPVGGFCEGDTNLPCNDDSQCAASSAGLCNLDAPNGKAGDLLTIYGYNFGNDPSKIKVYFEGSLDPVSLAPDLYSNCPSSISDNEIIVVVPSGSVAGSISVVINDEYGDYSNDETLGPQLEDFVLTGFSRPGICAVSPDAALTGEEVLYNGINFNSNMEAYFGNYTNNYKAYSFSSNSTASGLAVVPNISSSKTGTFVSLDYSNGATIYSNIVAFEKQSVPAARLGATISSFEPSSGNVGQYITIYGSGFGDYKGTSQVFFSGVEADYNFPQACLQSIWKDDRIVVKVPAGLVNSNYIIKVQVDSQENVSANSFSFDSSLALSPSICRLDPKMGPVSTSVKIWGEYFNNSVSLLRFYNQKDSAATNGDNDNGASTVSGSVPTGAISGPVRVVRNNLLSNGLNFTVGECSGDESCGGTVCCPFGSPKKGQCATNLLGCYYSVLASVFEWSFNTGIGTSCDGDATTAVCDLNNQLCPVGESCSVDSCTCQPCSGANCGGEGSSCSSDSETCSADNTLCNTGLTCNTSSCTCQSATAYSCAYKASLNDSCPTGFCPNSPGLCSADSSSAIQTAGNCDTSCNSINNCDDGSCEFSETMQYCFRGICDTDTKMTFDNLGELNVSCVQQVNYGNQWHFEINTSQNCPDGWFRGIGNKCVDSTSRTNSTCNVCDDGFKCMPNAELDGGAANDAGNGVCITGDKQCSSGYKCDGATNKCTKTVQESCACCCKIDAPAGSQCCTGTTCQGTCGDDTTDDGAGLGYCGGCYSEGNTVSQNDDTCNCSNASGKFCLANTKYPGGACVDCTQLDAESCSDHVSVCCWDGRDEVCRGGDGEAITKDVGDKNYGQCAYYACSGASCDKKYPRAYDNVEYKYSNIDSCTTACSDVPADCSDYNNAGSPAAIAASCIADSNCCFDQATSQCGGGSRLTSSDVGTAYVGYCAHYSCNSTAATCSLNTDYSGLVGPYSSLASCSAACQPLTPSGKLCAEDGSCQPDLCAGNFKCLIGTGYASAADSSCGTCCCDPNATTDACGDIYPALSCEADRGTCSGGSRGLCCGCTSDTQCSGGTTTGCSNTSCCEERPKIIESATSPLADQTNVCRNSIINIPFDQNIDLLTVSGNVILLAEKPTNEACPTGTITIPQEYSLVQRFLAFFDKAYVSVAKIFSNKVVAVSPDTNLYNYCLVSGSAIAEDSGSNTNIRFYPEKLLDPSTNYYVVVKGQEDVASSSNGIVSAKGIGLREDGYDGYYIGPWSSTGTSYPGSYIYSFTTMSSNNQSSGLCLVDKVQILPKSYLFDTASNDPVEDDININSATFDTKADKDKVYIANALAADGQVLNSIPGVYYWNFSWGIQNNKVVNFENVSGLTNSGDRRLVSVVPGVTDGSSEVSVQINIDGIFGPSSKSSSEKANVFICSNPWPATTTINGYLFWQPFIDENTNCSTGNCADYNYSFYYCRDSGVAGPDDDLPSLSGKGEVIRGQSDKKVCSNNREEECFVDADCDTGAVCVYEMLKESYFFSN